MRILLHISKMQKWDEHFLIPPDNEAGGCLQLPASLSGGLLMLRRNNRSGLSFQRIGSRLKRSDKYASFRVHGQIGNGGFDFGKHGAFFKLALRNHLFRVGDGKGGDCLLIFFSEIPVNAGNRGENNELIGHKVSRQLSGDGVLFNDCGSAL